MHVSMRGGSTIGNFVACSNVLCCKLSLRIVPQVNITLTNELQRKWTFAAI